jgi:hypothetical protein
LWKGETNGKFLTSLVEGRAMKRQATAMAARPTTNDRRKIACEKLRLAREKRQKSAQMPNYLLEQHPEFGK